ncbi:hypothetical protein GCM10023339_46620 [Alloalcanivorax gelatiniphagus]
MQTPPGPGPGPDPVWQFRHTVVTRAEPAFAWAFWTDVANWAAIDKDVDTVRLRSGPFAAGAHGITVTAGGSVTDWEVTEVHEPASARIRFPAPGASLEASWHFAAGGTGGCSITQEMVLHGPRAEHYRAAVAAGMEAGVPSGMEALATAIDAAFASDQLAR